MKITKLFILLLLSTNLFSQSQFKIENGTNIVSSGEPFINLNNINLNNSSTDTDFEDGTIWSLTGNSSITGTAITKFYGLRLNNSNGHTLSNNTTITNRLDMISGDINSSGYRLEIGSSISNPGVINWTSGTITGPLKRWFAPTVNSTQASGIFPIGNDANNRNVIINYTESPTEGGFIVAEYKSGVPSMDNNYSGLPLWTSDGQLIQDYEDQGYFDITPDNYNSSLNSKKYNLTIRANGLTTVNDRTGIRLLKSPGPSHTTWVACGDHSSVNGSSNANFTVTSTNVVGFSWFNFGGGPGNPLPIELTKFSADCNDDNIKVIWQTASEKNSSHFILQSSRNGIDWQDINKQTAAENSNELITYSFNDYNSIDGVNYYRLNQYDLDGTMEKFGPISVDCSKQVVGYLSVFPNPSLTSFNIIVNNNLLIGESLINITNELGQQVYSKNITISKGINSFPIQKLNINPGVYYISIINENYRSDVVKQIIK